MDEWNLLDLSYLVLSYDAVTSSSAAAASASAGSVACDAVNGLGFRARTMSASP